MRARKSQPLPHIAAGPLSELYADDPNPKPAGSAFAALAWAGAAGVLLFAGSLPGAARLVRRLAVCAQPTPNNKVAPADLCRLVFREYGIAGADPRD